jgi:hypothetical protein
MAGPLGTLRIVSSVIAMALFLGELGFRSRWGLRRIGRNLRQRLRWLFGTGRRDLERHFARCLGRRGGDLGFQRPRSALRRTNPGRG